MDEVANVLISIDLLLVVRDWSVLWFVLVDPSSPSLLVSLDSIRQLLEEESVFVGELMLGQGFQVEPGLLIHPVEGFVSIVDTCT